MLRSWDISDSPPIGPFLTLPTYLQNPYYQSAIALHIKEVLDAEKTVIDHSEVGGWYCEYDYRPIIIVLILQYLRVRLWKQFAYSSVIKAAAHFHLSATFP